MIFQTKDLFYTITNFLSPDDAVSLAQCCQNFRGKINALTASYWNRQIQSMDFKTFSVNIAVKWLDEKNDAKLSKTSYLALRFLRIHEFSSKSLNTFENLQMIPYPLLTSWLYDAGDRGSSFHKVWKLVPSEEKQRFYEIYITKSFDKEFLINSEISEDFIERGYCNLLKDRPKSKNDLLYTLLRHNRLSKIDPVIKLCKENPPTQFQLNTILLYICRNGGDLRSIQIVLDLGAKPHQVPSILYQVVQNRDDNEIYGILQLLINSGAINNHPFGYFLHSQAKLKVKAPILKLLINDLEFDKEIVEHFCNIRNYSTEAMVIEDFRMLQDLGIYKPGLDYEGNNIFLLLRSHRFLLTYVRLFLEAGEHPGKKHGNFTSPLLHLLPLCSNTEKALLLLQLFKEFKLDLSEETIVPAFHLKEINKFPILEFLKENGCLLDLDALKAIALEKTIWEGDLIEFEHLIRTLGEEKLNKLESQWMGPGRLVLNLADRVKRKKMTLILLENVQKKALFLQEIFHLISMGDIELYLEILTHLSTEDKKLFTNKDNIIDSFIAGVISGNIQNLDGAEKIFPSESLRDFCWKISFKLDNSEAHIKLLQLAKKWIDKHPEKDRFCAKWLSDLFGDCDNPFLLPESVRNYLFSILFKKDYLLICHKNKKNALQKLFKLLGSMAMSEDNWKEIKEWLLPMNLNFDSKESKSILKIFLRAYAKKANQFKLSDECLRDIIRFAWTNLGSKQIVKKSTSPLHLAVSLDPLFADELIKLGHPLDCQDSSNTTPLYLAIVRGNTELACRLIDLAARTDIPANIRPGETQTAKELAKRTNLQVFLKMTKFKNFL